MQQQAQTSFADTPVSVDGHFMLHVYAAIFYFSQYIVWLHRYGGESLHDTCIRYPFLSQYHAQMQLFMPDKMPVEQGAQWWQQQILDWEKKCKIQLPLKTLAEQCGFSFSQRMALLLCGLVEEDSRFGTLVAEFQAPLNQRFFTLELLKNVLNCQANVDIYNCSDVAEQCQSLMYAGYVQCLNQQVARSEWLMRVPLQIWDCLRSDISDHTIKGFRYFPAQSLATIEELLYEDDFKQKLARLLAIFQHPVNKTLIIRANPGSDMLEVFGAVARSLQLNMLCPSLQSSLDQNSIQLLGPLCALSQSVPVLCYELAPGESVTIPSIDAWNGVIGMGLGLEGGINADDLPDCISITLPEPDRSIRIQRWQTQLGKDNQAIEAIADNFYVGGKYIKQIAGMAISTARFEGAEQVQLEHVRAASSNLNRQMLDDLADPIQSTGSWGNLVCNQNTHSKLLELQTRCAQREQLLQHLGVAFKNNSNRGVRALFTGVSGTGKTLAAKVLAAETGMDLYRVDLASVINKYIGETEKNLHKILSRAEALDIILLLDEGDSVLAARTDVKTANDRYANLETNYLLQRLENYQGIIVITTNLSENIDRAFQRRMDVVVPFYAPQGEQRWDILHLHLPGHHQLSEDYLIRVAQQCHLTGGQLRNVVTNATLQSLQQDHGLDDMDLQHALKAEYQKAGAVFPLQKALDDDVSDQDEMHSFISGLKALKS